MNKDIEYLQKYGRILNLEIKADKIDPIIGRDEEIRRIIEILSRKKKSNPLLVGEAGVGKTAIVEGLAQRIHAGTIPTVLKNRKIFELDLALLIAGTKFQGEFEERLKKVMKIIASDNDFLLFIDELHLLVGAGKTQGAMDAANIMKPLLSRGELKCIGATTGEEYHQYIEKDSALERRFQTILVHEPNVEATITILRGLKETFESFHGISLKDNALIAAAKLSDRYLTQRNLPDKAIDLIDEACAKIKTDLSSLPHDLEVINRQVVALKIEKKVLAKENLADFDIKTRLAKIETHLQKLLGEQTELNSQWEAEKTVVRAIADLKAQIKFADKNLAQAMKEGKYEEAGELQYQTIPNLRAQLKTKLANFKGTLIKDKVTERDIANVIAKITRIPVQQILTSMQKKLLNLFAQLKKRIKGQDHALKAVNDALLRNQTGFGSYDRPIGSFFFLGSTGVGKTLVAKALAEILFDTPKRLIRIDMSEYAEKHTISRLIGSPPGYVGYEQGGQLTERVKQNPFTVILFDEFEKAHPEIQNLLLPILDEGHLTDNRGKLINFKNTIIIMTSNLASETIYQQTEQEQEGTLRKFLTPEFINRLDEIVVFNRLNTITLNEIVLLELKKVFARIKDETQVMIQVDNSIVQKILSEIDPKNYGARPIRRYIEKHLLGFLTSESLKKNLEPHRVYVLKLDKNQKLILAKPVLN